MLPNDDVERRGEQLTLIARSTFLVVSVFLTHFVALFVVLRWTDLGLDQFLEPTPTVTLPPVAEPSAEANPTGTGNSQS